jgi:uncharacterized protein
MRELTAPIPRPTLVMRWQPTKTLWAVALSWLLVTGTLYTATVIVGSQVAGGLAYFGLYAILTATVFGLGIPLYWTVAVRRRPVSDLGITARRLGPSLTLQFVFSVALFLANSSQIVLPPLEALVPLVALALAIGLFEAVFWRGWVLLRLEEAFGVLPALLLGSVLYALYHVGYGMPLSEITFLLFIGLLYGITFRLTKSIFLVWPLFQPMGQLMTLTRDGLLLPLPAALGFGEVLALMVTLTWLAARWQRKHAIGAISSVHEARAIPGPTPSR